MGNLSAVTVTFKLKTGVYLWWRTCLVDRTCSDAASAQHTLCTAGAPPFPWNCHKGQHLASLRTAQEHRLLKVLVPVSLGSLPAPARRAPRPGRPGGTRTHLHSRARSKGARSWTGRASTRWAAERSGAGGRASVRTEGAWPAVPSSPAASVAPGPGRGRGPHRALPPPGRTGGAGSPRARAAPLSPAFPPLHLFCLLLLPPATRSVTTSSRLARVPRKRETGGKTRGNNFPRRRRARRWSPPEGPAPSLHVAAAALCRGARRGRGRRLRAACSGTNCPTLRQGPGPGPSPRINSRPAGPKKLPGESGGRGSPRTTRPGSAPCAAPRRRRSLRPVPR